MKSRLARRLATTISAVVLVIAVALAALMVVPSLLGYERYVIRTGSMAPGLPIGAVVFDRVVPVDSLKVGDVITFTPPREFGIESPVTHRIVEIDHRADTEGVTRRVFRTKGDNNPSVDPWHLVFDHPKVALVVHHLPYVGYAYLLLSQRWVQISLIGVPAVLIAVMLGYLLWQVAGQAVREEREKTEDDAGEGDAVEGDPVEGNAGEGGTTSRRRVTKGVQRSSIALAAASAVVLGFAGTASAAFTTEQLTPQTIAAGIWVPVPSALLAVQAPRPHTQANQAQIPISLTLVNRGSTAVDLTGVTIRYWFTAEPLSLTVECDYFPGGSCAANIVSTIGTVSPALPGADHYYQLAFLSGTLAPGASIQNIQVRVTNAPDYAHYFDVTNDWSYRGLVDHNPAEDAPCITAYVAGLLVWGEGPSNSPSPACAG